MMFAKNREQILGDRLDSLRARILRRCMRRHWLNSKKPSLPNAGSSWAQNRALLYSQRLPPRTFEQARLCDEANLMRCLVDRVNPLIFRGSVKKA